MPTYGTRFTCVFSNDLDEIVEIVIGQLNYTGLVQQLTADADCINIKSIVGDEDKLNPICGMECTLKFLIGVNDNVSVTDFVSSQDNYFQVTIYREQNYSAPEFIGFVVVEDNNQPFLDPPYTIAIKATDMLGLLQGIYFLDANGNVFTGKMTIIGWLAQILNQTGQALNLRTYFNIYHASFLQTANALEQICLDAVTFQTGQQTPAGDTNPADFNTGFDDYYTVLQKIVQNFRCKIFQEGGYWHLVNLWDYYSQSGMHYFEYSFGAPVNGIVPYTLVGRGDGITNAVNVSKIDTLGMVNEDALLYLKIAKKSIELTYNYNQALNKIINQALDQGVRQPAQDEIINSQYIDLSLKDIHNNYFNLQTIAYSLFGYGIRSAPTLQNVVAPNLGNSSPATPDNAFIRIVHDQLGNEMQRFAVLKIVPNPTVNYIITTSLLIDTADIFQLSFSFKTRTDTHGTLANQRWILAYVLLTGDDGSFWMLESTANGTIINNPTAWQPCTSSAFQNQFGTMLGISSASVPDTRYWTFVEANTQALPGVPFAQAPTSGTIQVVFQAGLGPGTEIWIKDITIKVLPYLNGSFQQLQGDYNYAESAQPIKATVKDDVQISDSPKRYFQGALLSNANGYVLLTAQWARYGYSESLRFTQIMAYLMYTALCRQVQKIEGTVRGISYPDDGSANYKSPAGFRNVYFFLDHDVPTKKWMLCSFDRNYNTGQWRGVFIELNLDQNDQGLISPDFYEFSYLFTGVT